MSDTTEDKIIKKINALKAYKQFVYTITTKDNEKIENTEIIMMLKRLFSESIYEQDTPPAIDIPSSDIPFYRARIIDDLIGGKDKGIEFSENEILSGYNKYESKEPPLGISVHGRNNYIGSSYLYLSDDIYTACIEVRPNPGNYISLATFRVKSRMRIVDFSKSYSYKDDDKNYSVDFLMNLLPYIFSQPYYNDDEQFYYATQYISDMIRKYGFDGICYNSSLSNGKNYTIFNCNDNNIEFISSRVIVTESVNFNFYDFNSLEKYIEKHKTEIDIESRLSAERAYILGKAKMHTLSMNKAQQACPNK